MPRYLKESISSDLSEKMVFLGGPRQVGKTTLALSFLKPSTAENPAYLNWDISEDRKMLKSGHLPSEQALYVLDEIHKFRGWRNLTKGFFDQYHRTRKFLITGSARLDYYRFGGDSLQGRYHYYRLHPFSLPELKSGFSKSDFKTLLRFGGFPEPLFKGTEKFWRRWQKERMKRVIYEDLISLEKVHEVASLQLLVDELPERVGSILSVNSLAEDLQVSFKTVQRWLQIFEHLYLSFRIAPFGARRIRAVKKEQKLYLWDWSLCSNAGHRFENLVAAQLLKYCHFVEDTEGYGMDLRFIRDTDKREIDFVVLKEGKPLFAVECKSGEKSISPALRYFSQRTDIPYFYQVHLGTADFENKNERTRVLPFIKFAQTLGLP